MTTAAGPSTASGPGPFRIGLRWVRRAFVAFVLIAVLDAVTDRRPTNQFEADKAIAASVDYVRRFHEAFPLYTIQAEHFSWRGPIKTFRYRCRVRHPMRLADIEVGMFLWCSFDRWGAVDELCPSPYFAAWVLYPTSVPLEERWRNGRGFEDRVKFSLNEFDALLKSDLNWRVVGIDI
jgi:hypothetical protein